MDHKRNEIHGYIKSYIKTDAHGHNKCIVNTVSGLKNHSQLDKAYSNILATILILIWSTLDPKKSKEPLNQNIKYFMSKDLKNFDTNYLIYAM